MGFQTLMDRRSYLSLLAGLGSSVALFSVVFALAFAKLLTQGEGRILYLLGFAVAACVGSYLARHALRGLMDLRTPPEHSSPAPRSPFAGQVMLLARSTKGRLSASEVAAATSLSVAESHRVLRSLVKEGAADIWITDEGGVVYVFPELFEGFKETARSPLAHPLD